MDLSPVLRLGCSQELVPVLRLALGCRHACFCCLSSLSGGMGDLPGGIKKLFPGWCFLAPAGWSQPLCPQMGPQ